MANLVVPPNEQIMAIYRFHDDYFQDMPDHPHHFTSSSNLVTKAVNRLSELQLHPKDKILDMGSGRGIPSLVFSLTGLLTYGVEENAEMVQESQRFIIAARQRFAWLPNPEPRIIRGDYLNPSFRNECFSDGTTPTEMKAFYCYTYNSNHSKLVRTAINHLVRQEKAYLEGYFDVEEHHLGTYNPLV